RGVRVGRDPSRVCGGVSQTAIRPRGPGRYQTRVQRGFGHQGAEHLAADLFALRLAQLYAAGLSIDVQRWRVTHWTGTESERRSWRRTRVVASARPRACDGLRQPL